MRRGQAGRLIFTAGALIWLATVLVGPGLRTVSVLAALAAIFIGLPVWVVQAVRRRRRSAPRRPQRSR